MHRCPLVLAFCLLLAPSAHAAPEETAPGPEGAILRLEAGGPTSPVTGLAFSPDGKRLYVAGWDKAVRVYTLKGGQFRLEPQAFRIPVGPGLEGAIDSLALSDDGEWLAVAGLGASSQGPGFRQGGVVVPFLASEARNRDRGTIYVFNTRTRAVRLLRGHHGHIEALAFAPTRKDQPPLLCSVAREQTGDDYTKVARAWELGKDVTSREWWAGLPGNPGRVGLTVWHGKDGKEAWAALSLGDQKFRAGNLESNKNHEAKELPYTVTAAALPGQPRCLTACFGDGKARLRLWEFGEGTPPRAPEQGFGARQNTFPRALSLASREGTGKADCAAVIVRRMLDGGSEMRLQLLDLAAGKQGEVLLDQQLWEGGERDPILATSLRGRHLALAGNKAHEVWVFPLDGRGRPAAKPQKIASDLTPFRHVSFVRHRESKNLGVLLNSAARKARPGDEPPTPDARKGDWVFDLKNSTLSEDPSGWQPALPDVGGLRAERAEGETRDSLFVYRGRLRLAAIDLPAGHRVADHALLGPGPHGTPLLAVAANFLGQPALMLFNAQSGQQVRSFTGHSGPLSAVAFSPDGRYLASAADDQTVNLWGLTDLNTTLGAHGRLPDVAVVMKDGQMTVAYVLPDSPARGQLSPGDVIEAIGQKKNLTAPSDFYSAFYETKPGQKVRVVVRGRGPVELTASQAIDERKPLFSLAVERTAPRDWIAWNPFGPYETPTRRAERYLGWLFNTNKAEEPTRFAAAEAHRDDFFRKGLIRQTVETGKVIEKAALPSPTINPQVQVGDATRPDAFRTPDAADRVVADREEVQVHVYLGARPLYTLDRVTWKVGDGKETPLPHDVPEGMPLSFPLTLTPRKEVKVTITAYTPDGAARDTAESFLVRHQPPPAEVTPGWDKGHVTTEEEDFTLTARVRPGLDGEGVRLTVRHWHGGKEQPARPQKFEEGSPWPAAVSEEVKLARGENRFVVEAVNLGAPEGPEGDREKRTAELVVHFSKQDPPPVFTFEGTVSASGLSMDRSLLVTDLPTVTLSGRVTAEEGNLDRVEWGKVPAGRDAPEKWANAAGFEPGKAKSFALSEEVSLQPGRQVFRFRAQTKGSAEGAHEVIVEYRPKLPTVQLTRPKEEFLLGETEKATYRLEGRLRFPDDRRPFRAVLLVNGEEQAAWPPKPGAAGALTVDDEGNLKADVTVRPRVNRIQVRVSNDWDTLPRSDEVRVRYGRPPRLQGEMELVSAGKDRPTVDVRARVWSPVPLKKEQVEVKVNDQPAQVGEVALTREGDVTTILLREVLLQAGTKQDTLHLSAFNDEAAKPATGKLLLPPKGTIFPPAEVTVDSLPSRVFNPEAEVGFTLSSESRVTSVVLEWGPESGAGNVNQAERQKKTLPLAEGVKEGALYKHRFRVKVPLTARNNHFTVRAVNNGGDTPLELGKVTYVPPPITLKVDRLTPGGLRAEAMEFKPGRDGRLTIPRPSPDGRVEIEGRILWLDAAAKAQARPDDRTIRIYANGFQQSLALVDHAAGDSTVTPFKATILLNQEENEVGLWSAKEDPDKRITLDLPCTAPVTEQRQHLLILSPRSKEPPDVKFLETKAFAQHFTYGPLVGQDVTWENIDKELKEIRSRILSLAHTRPPRNDVVIICYLGGERLGIEGPQGIKGAAFEAPPGPPPGFNIHSDELADALADIPGAHTLWMEVERGEQVKQAEDVRDTIARWPEEYPRAGFHVSILRYAWDGRDVFPEKARLMVGFQEAVQKESQLRDVLAAMGALVVPGSGTGTGPLRSTREEGPLRIFTYVPKGLVGLRLGR